MEHHFFNEMTSHDNDNHILMSLEPKKSIAKQSPPLVQKGIATSRKCIYFHKLTSMLKQRADINGLSYIVCRCVRGKWGRESLYTEGCQQTYRKSCGPFGNTKEQVNPWNLMGFTQTLHTNPSLQQLYNLYILQLLYTEKEEKEEERYGLLIRNVILFFEKTSPLHVVRDLYGSHGFMPKP